MSQQVASRLGLRYLDSGALYRGVALWLSRSGIPAEEGEALDAALAEIDLQISDSPEPAKVILNGADVSREIRSLEVTALVSAAAALPSVRATVSRIAAGVIADGGIVIEGRDIGSVVAPDAQVKIFLTASGEVRAQRRWSELDGASLAEASESLSSRDAVDSTRAHSPLTQVEGAEVIDSSDLGIEDVVDAIVALANRSGTPS